MEAPTCCTLDDSKSTHDLVVVVVGGVTSTTSGSSRLWILGMRCFAGSATSTGALAAQPIGPEGAKNVQIAATSRQFPRSVAAGILRCGRVLRAFIITASTRTGGSITTFSSRTQQRVNGLGISKPSVQELVEGQHTAALQFCLPPETEGDVAEYACP